MNILFICGCAEFGADGVGDYAFGLGRELARRGWSVGICAVCDSHCDEVRSIGQFGEGGICVLRLPIGLSWSDKAREMSSWLGNWRPGIVSLQYVHYSFHRRGLPFGFGKWIQSHIEPGIEWHIMFHELWVGFTCISPWRHRLIGMVQKKIAQRLVGRIKPKVVHTSNNLYVQILADAGIRAKRLPLFTSIIVSSVEREWMWGQLNELGITVENRKQWRVVGFFGSCHPDVPIEKMVSKIFEQTKMQTISLVVIGIGGGDAVAWECRVKSVNEGIVVKHLGRQSSDRVSAFLQNLDQGLPNAPLQFRGKSSSAAAMNAHGVYMDDSYQIEIPEYKCRWRAADGDVFLPVERVVDDLILCLSADITRTIS